MANIGYINRNDKGQLVGKIETLAFTGVIGLREVHSNNPKAPAYDVMALAQDRRTWVKIGAAFEHASSRTGVVFYQGTIDDPALAAPMSIAFFANDEEGFNIAWTRRRPRREFADGEQTQQEEGEGLDNSAADDGAFVDGMTGPKRTRRKATEADPFAPTE